MKKTSVLIFVALVLGFGVRMNTVAGKNQVKTSNLRLTQIAGLTLFDEKKCSDCHTTSIKPEGKLTPVINMRDEAWFMEHLRSETEIILRSAESKRKKQRVLKEEVAALTDYLYKSKPSEKKQVDALPEPVLKGAYLAYRNNCLGCHSIAGSGKEVAPALTFIAAKQDEKEWHIRNLKDPQQFQPESPMPKFNKLSESELNLLADYLLTLRK